MGDVAVADISGVSPIDATSAVGDALESIVVGDVAVADISGVSPIDATSAVGDCFESIAVGDVGTKPLLFAVIATASYLVSGDSSADFSGSFKYDSSAAGSCQLALAVSEPAFS
ncbi:hypothetical protein MiSe_75430 [Microseira wollei NIES-4236]|uniref:Uncharacterized protein n=1 Tax=Microseira wollei NIES-4236 TaxID=2530354 RepID=A0AAV3XLB3_9CYAN|nr:hypothetical protein MiSe_75430 [Microseira wollei NIES-4236]